MSPRDANGHRRGHIRADLKLIAQMIEPGSRVLDVGCGDGALLELLVREKNAVGRGVEISQAGVNACVSNGLSAVQGDADTDLKNYPSNAFDYVVLSQTLQATRQPRVVLEDLVRLGRRAIVSFPNFGHWRVRGSLLFQGCMPMSRALPDRWYETPNIHLCTIHDFRDLCHDSGIDIEKSLALNNAGYDKRIVTPRWANLLAEHGLFVLRQARDR